MRQPAAVQDFLAGVSPAPETVLLRMPKVTLIGRVSGST